MYSHEIFLFWLMWLACNIFMAYHSHHGTSIGSQNIWSSLWYMSSMVVHFWSFRALIVLRMCYDLDNPEGRHFFAEMFPFLFPWMWRFLPSKLKTSTHDSTMWKGMEEVIAQAKTGIWTISFVLGKYAVWGYYNTDTFLSNTYNTHLIGHSNLPLRV